MHRNLVPNQWASIWIRSQHGHKLICTCQNLKINLVYLFFVLSTHTHHVTPAEQESNL